MDNEEASLKVLQELQLKALTDLETKVNKVLEKAEEREEIDLFEHKQISTFFELGCDYARKIQSESLEKKEKC